MAYQLICIIGSATWYRHRHGYCLAVLVGLMVQPITVLAVITLLPAIALLAVFRLLAIILLPSTLLHRITPLSVSAVLVQPKSPPQLPR